MRTIFFNVFVLAKRHEAQCGSGEFERKIRNDKLEVVLTAYAVEPRSDVQDKSSSPHGCTRSMC